MPFEACPSKGLILQLKCCNSQETRVLLAVPDAWLRLCISARVRRRSAVYVVLTFPLGGFGPRNAA